MPSAQCPEKESILNKIQMAMTELIAIHDREVQALIRGDITSDASLQRRLQQARDHKDLLIERLRGHVSEHGC